MAKQKLSEVFKIREAGMFGSDSGGSKLGVGAGSPGVDSPLDGLHPQEKQEIDAFMKGGDDVQLNQELEAKLVDYYANEMPTGVQQGKEGTPDEWLFDRLSQLPEYQ